jgi:hypothetical protein
MALPVLFPVYSELLANVAPYPQSIKNSRYILNIHPPQNPKFIRLNGLRFSSTLNPCLPSPLKDGDRIILKVPQIITAQKMHRGDQYLENEGYLNTRIFMEQFYKPAINLLGSKL